MTKKYFFCDVILEQNTSKIKNKRLNCKTTDLREDANTIFKTIFDALYENSPKLFFNEEKLPFLVSHF